VSHTRNTAIAFVGGGRITSALAAGLRLAKDHRDIFVYDRNPEKLRVLRRESGVAIARDLNSAMKTAGILIVAVRPSSVAEVLSKLAQCQSLPRICLSLAAGIPLRNLRRFLPSARWVRAMPSPVCRVGRGLTALCFHRGLGKKDRDSVRELFGRVGQVVEIAEPKFDVFTATYSSSHGYHALESLSSAAQRAGLDRKTSLMAAAHALADGISYWRDGGIDLAELLQEATTPGGIAAATMLAMDRAGYRKAVQNGVAAGIRQAQRNAGTSSK
jgi:pyrroline-5-carboxylate reductase